MREATARRHKGDEELRERLKSCSRQGMESDFKKTDRSPAGTFVFSFVMRRE